MKKWVKPEIESQKILEVSAQACVKCEVGPPLNPACAIVSLGPS